MSKKFKTIWIKMSKIKQKFLELDAKKEKALISYIMAGFPNERATLSAVKGLVKGGLGDYSIRNYKSAYLEQEPRSSHHNKHYSTP